MPRVGVTRGNRNGLDGPEERTEADDDAGQIEPGGQHRGDDEDRDADSGEQPACRQVHEKAIESQSGVICKAQQTRERATPICRQRRVMINCATAGMTNSPSLKASRPQGYERSGATGRGFPLRRRQQAKRRQHE